MTCSCSSLIQTLLSAPESHRINQKGSRALPPVRNYTVPEDSSFLYAYHSTLTIRRQVTEIHNI